MITETFSEVKVTPESNTQSKDDKESRVLYPVFFIPFFIYIL